MADKFVYKSGNSSQQIEGHSTARGTRAPQRAQSGMPPNTAANAAHHISDAAPQAQAATPQQTVAPQQRSTDIDAQRNAKVQQRAASFEANYRQGQAAPARAKKRTSKKTKRLSVMLIILLIFVVLSAAVLVYLKFFGSFGSVAGIDVNEVYALRGENILPQHFVSGEGLEAEFVQPPDFEKSGRQTVRLNVTKDGKTHKINAKMLVVGENTIEMESGIPLTELAPSDFLSAEHVRLSSGFVSDFSALQIDESGKYEIKLDINGRVATCYVGIIDNVPPQATPLFLEIWSCDNPEAIDFFENIIDDSPVTARFVNPPDFTVEGKQEFEIILSDAAGNESVYNAGAFVMIDTQPPEFVGLEDFSVLLNSKVSYRSSMELVDNHPEEPTLDIDSSAVNAGVAGTYPVTYTATDKSGNTAQKQINITVLDVSEEMVYTLADDVLASIVNNDMSQREKARAIHTWTNSNIRYVNTGGALEVMQGAYSGFKNKKGDCYVYYAVSEILLTRAGIENQGVERVGGISTHFWNIVEIDGTWYHFDACPTPSPFDTFLFGQTEAASYTQEAVAYNRTNYYVYDEEDRPVISMDRY